MKIVTWNCNGALRNKFEHLKVFDADIYIIQECENPDLTSHIEYKEWANNHLWIGDSKNKGIGIFAKNDFKLKKCDWTNDFKNHAVKYFLPCLINEKIQILAVWTHKNNSPNFGYIGQFWKYIQVNKSKFNDIIIAGDLNSNAIWDQWDRWWNHSDVVNELNEIGVESLYHKFHKESQGKESQPTFYLHRNLAKPYHIDYCFASRKFVDKLEDCNVGKFDEWKHLSDHSPLIVTLK
jgi:exonuclease III